MRKIFAIVLSVAVITSLVLIGCAPEAAPEEGAPPAAPEAEYKWRMGSATLMRTEEQASGLFCDLVNYYSGGRIELEYYPGGLLGNHDEIFNAMQAGDIEVGAITPYVNLVPGGMLNWMPWTVGTFDEAAIAFTPPDGILFKVMTEAWNEVGFHYIIDSVNGPYNLENTVRPLRTPDDFKNWKFRVSGSLGFVRCMENMSEGTGMTLETLPASDIYNAYERGVIDGSWSTFSSLVESRRMEVVKYYTVLGFSWSCYNVAMNKDLWDKLPAELQDAINKAGKAMQMWSYEAQRRNSVIYKQTVEDMGVEVYYPTAQEREAFRVKANMAGVWEELCDPWLEEHYPGQNMSQKIQDELLRISRIAAQ